MTSRMGKPAAALAASIVVSLLALAPSTAAKPCPRKRCQVQLAVAISSPANAAVVGATLDWQATVTSGSAYEVDFFVDGQQQGSDTAAPFDDSLDTSRLANGQHTLAVRALATSGQSASASIAVDVENAAPAPAYSPSRHVYCFGDPTWGTAGFSADGTSNAWIRQYPLGLPDRVSFDDSNPTGQLLGCHTLRNHLEPTDPSTGGGTDIQRADAYSSSSILTQHNEPDLGDARGQTTYYGFAFQTSSTFPVKPAPNWQLLWDYHHGGLTCASTCYITQQAIELDLQTQGYATTRCADGGAPFPDGQPHIVISINGGNADDPNWTSSADGTCLRYAGPAFVAGHRYRVAFKATWGDHHTGAMQVWIDGVQYADVSGIDDMIYSASSGDQAGVYPKFANYRKYDTSYPATDVWFSGLVTGATLADVTIP